MKKLLTILFLTLTINVCRAQTANNFPLAPFTQSYGYASNQGYPSPDSSNFGADQTAQMVWNAGGRNIRVYLPDYYVSQYGANFAAYDFSIYNAIGYTNITAFLGGCYSGNSINYTFSGTSTPSWFWRGMYDSIYHWNGSIDTANTFANYVYKTVNYYSATSPKVTMWEIVNEMLIAGGNFNVNPSDPNYWGTHMPTANQLPNAASPFPYCVRLMRIAYTVIKNIDPTAHISIGGMIATEEMKCMATYTDNPGAGDISGAGSGTAGSVTTAYPLAGSAYFDVLDMHVYPIFSRSDYANNCNYYGQWSSNANSDYSVQILKAQINGFDSTAQAAGYNGTTYPKKIKIITEMDLPKTTNYGFYGNDTMNANFLMKAHIKLQTVGVVNAYKFGLFDNPPYSAYFSNMGMLGDITRLGLTIATVPKDSGYYANRTLDTLLYGTTYDSAATAALAIPSNMDGASFKYSNGTHIFALWAKTTNYENESASATYTLPAGTFIEYPWNYSETNAISLVSGSVTVNSQPSFFLLSQVQPPPPIVGAGKRLTATWVNGQVKIGLDSTGTISSLKVCYGIACTQIAPTNLYTPTQLGQLMISATGYTSDTLNVPSIFMSQWYNQVQVNINEGTSGKWGLWNTSGVQKQTGNYSKGLNTIKMATTNYPHGIYSFVTADLVIKINL